MPAKVPDDWPNWPSSDLESLGRCPVCGDKGRTVLYTDLIDRWFHAEGRWTLYQCEECASAYIDPRPTAASIHRAYANYETHRPIQPEPKTDSRFATRLRNDYLNRKYRYKLQPASPFGYLAMHLLPPPLRLEWDHYARHLRPPKPGKNRLLDVGCGNGEFLARARTQGWAVHGLDVDDGALAHARNAGIPVTRGDVVPATFPANSFDAITTHQVIEHAHDPVTFLKAIFEWLKPGGRVWLGTPNNTSALHRQFGADWCDLHPPQHIVILSAKSLLKLMTSTGFCNARLLPRGYLDSHFYSQSRRMREMTEPGDWQTLNSTDGRDTAIHTRILLETRAWLRPELGSDLVAVAWKPAR